MTKFDQGLQKAWATISGRGFGLDAVAHYLQELGGGLDLVLASDAKDQNQPVLFRMHWPREARQAA